MRLKYGIEQKLKESKIAYTIFRLTRFYQGLIEQYAIPILENLPIWVTNENTSISYIDTQDIAKFCLRTLQIPETINQTFFLSGLKGWASSEIIGLCEQLAGQTAKVQKVPIIFLKVISNFFGFFEWGQNISERLAFVEILNTENNFSKSTFDLHKIFKIESEELIQLDDYFLEYFVRLLKRLRDINFEDVQKQKNLTTQIWVELPQFRHNRKILLIFWGNLGNDVKNFYQINDYIFIEGYISIKKTNLKLTKIILTGLKVYPIFLNLKSIEKNN